MNQDVLAANTYVIRVVGIDGEVVRALRLVVDAYSTGLDPGAGTSAEPLPGLEVSGVDPAPFAGDPEGVVGGGDNAGVAGVCFDGYIGKVFVVLSGNGGQDRTRPSFPTVGVRGEDLVAGFEVLDGTSSAICHLDFGVGQEAVAWAGLEHLGARHDQRGSIENLLRLTKCVVTGPGLGTTVVVGVEALRPPHVGQRFGAAFVDVGAECLHPQAG